MSEEFLDDLINEVNQITSSSDRLEIVRKAVKNLRELEYERIQLEEQIASVKSKILEYTRDKLVKLFNTANITSISLEADGNYPPVLFERATFYEAKIPEDKELEAFGWLHDNGHGDIVKTQISVALGMGERELAQNVEKAISDAGADYNSKLGVHPSTLKSFVKNEIESGRAVPMDLFGVYAGEVVKLKKGK